MKKTHFDEGFERCAPGVLFCLIIAVPCWYLGDIIPVLGSSVIAILVGMIIAQFPGRNDALTAGIKFTSKQILKWAVVLLGFGLNLGVVAKTGLQSLPIILAAISVSLIISFILCRVMKVPGKIATLVGVGSSICGGSAVAATAPVIDADDEEVAQAISVIFFFDIFAALFFPTFGKFLGLDAFGGSVFGIFSGIAVHDTSSVTAVAATWDDMWNLGTAALDTAVTVKLTRTLFIIPITLVLALWRTHKAKKAGGGAGSVSLKKIFPFFILFFIAASLISTVCQSVGVPASFFSQFKTVSKFLIVLAMTGIGLSTDLVKLVKSGSKPLFIGLCCWLGIICVCLGLQHALGLI